jgi:hypothetical protein
LWRIHRMHAHIRDLDHDDGLSVCAYGQTGQTVVTPREAFVHERANARGRLCVHVLAYRARACMRSSRGIHVSIRYIWK